MFILRFIIAAALIFGAWQGARLNIRNAKAEMLSVAGREMAETESGLFIGMDKVREAYRIAPQNPDHVLRRANLLIKRENNRARAGDRTSFDYANLEEVYGLMAVIQSSHDRPVNVNIAQADIANMLASMKLLEGDRQASLEYAQKALDNILEVRRVLGRIHNNPDIMYENGIRRAAQLERHDLVLTFWDDYRRFFPWVARKNPDMQFLVNYSRRHQGETSVLVAETTRLLAEDPKNPRLLGDLFSAGMKGAAWRNSLLVLDVLERRGLLDRSLHGFQQQLLDLFRREEAAKVPSRPKES